MLRYSRKGKERGESETKKNVMGRDGIRATTEWKCGIRGLRGANQINGRKENLGEVTPLPPPHPERKRWHSWRVACLPTCPAYR